MHPKSILICSLFAVALVAPTAALAQAPASASDPIPPAIARPVVTFSPASAAAPRVPRRQGPSSFAGGYVGGVIGFAKVKAETLGTLAGTSEYWASTSVPAINALGVQELDGDFHPLFGGTAGFNGQFGAAVVGVEGDFQILKLDDEVSAEGVYPCCAPSKFTVTQTITSDWLFTARGRAGGVAGPALIYGTAGLAMAKMQFVSRFKDDFEDSLAESNADFDETRKGFVIGAGVEVKVGPHVSVKGEFLHFNFGDLEPFSTSQFILGGTDVGGETFTNEFTKIRMNAIRFGVNFGF